MNTCPITDCPRCKEIEHSCDLNLNPMDCSHSQWKMKPRKKDSDSSCGFENSQC
jgi:hypothetical protein